MRNNKPSTKSCKYWRPLETAWTPQIFLFWFRTTGKLAVLVSTGKSKEAFGTQLTHEQVKRLTDKEVKKFYKRYEAYLGSKTTETLMQSFLMLASKAIGMVVKVDDVEALQKDL